MVSETENQSEASVQENVNSDPDENLEQDANIELEQNTLVVMHEKYEIDSEHPLPHLDQKDVKAYRALQRGDSQPMYFALICERDNLPRTKDVEKYASLDNSKRAHLVRAGVVFWPPAKEQRFVLIYQNNLGKPIMSDWQTKGLAWKADKIIKNFVKPSMTLLLDLRDKGLTHRAINPLNIFDGGRGQEAEKYIIGDCLSCPPGYRQPAAFESIERAMAQPESRGEGTIEDDLYAMGVTITYLMRHNNPIVSMSDEEITKSKIEIGSYGALTVGERFSGPLLELLRGLLYDAPSQRLTLEEIMNWLDGQRLLPRQPVMAKKANRPLPFDGKSYVRPAILAQNLHHNPAEANQLIENGDIHLWISRSLEDEVMQEKYETLMALASAQGKGAGSSERSMAYAIMAMSPESPISYKGLNVCVDGVSYSMAKAFHEGKDLQPYHDLITHEFILRWLSVQKDDSVDRSYLNKQFDLSKKSLKQRNLGYGIERALYLISSESPCMSEILNGYCVMGMSHLMDALEQISQTSTKPELPIDRHIAAFISVRDSKAIDSFLLELNSSEYFKRILANLRILAILQKRLKLDAFPGVASWMLSIMEPVFERYHDRDQREMMKKYAAQIAAKGDLIELSAYVDNDITWKNDLSKFTSAMQEYRKLRIESEQINYKLSRPELFGKDVGQEIAAVASGVLSGIIILVFAFIYMFTG